MESSLLNLVKNVFEGIHKINCKYGHNNKTNVKVAELNLSTDVVFFNIQTLKIILFYYCENLFILMNIWMVGKNSMKYHELKKKISTVT